MSVVAVALAALVFGLRSATTSAGLVDSFVFALGVMVALVPEAGIDTAAANATAPRIGEFPFDSERKLMTTLHPTPGPREARPDPAGAGGHDGPTAPRRHRRRGRLPQSRHPDAMVTGDYGVTAEAIARRVGIVTGPHPGMVSGQQLEAVSTT